MKYGRKFAAVVLGILCCTLVGVLSVKDAAAIAGSIALIVGSFNGAHAVQDNANAKAGKPGV